MSSNVCCGKTYLISIKRIQALVATHVALVLHQWFLNAPAIICAFLTDWSQVALAPLEQHGRHLHPNKTWAFGMNNMRYFFNHELRFLSASLYKEPGFFLEQDSLPLVQHLSPGPWSLVCDNQYLPTCRNNHSLVVTGSYATPFSQNFTNPAYHNVAVKYAQ